MIKNSLVIGKTSQLSYFFPSEYDRISSRDINFSNIKNYDKIYITFAEQRTFLNETEKFFTDINVDYTLEVINKIKHLCNRVVVFSTSELWNDYEGPVSLDLKFKYNYSPYIKSKEILSEQILSNRHLYPNVDIIYPFNFNSPYRKEGFLFSKIFKSIITKEKISVGDLDFNRDIIHPEIIIKNSISSNGDLLIGSGQAIAIKKFITILYEKFDLDPEEYIFFDSNNNLNNNRKEYYSKMKYSSEIELIDLTYKDIKREIELCTQKNP
jgi:nucleoside-diphosphate-sugar epimerase